MKSVDIEDVLRSLTPTEREEMEIQIWGHKHAPGTDGKCLLCVSDYCETDDIAEHLRQEDFDATLRLCEERLRNKGTT